MLLSVVAGPARAAEAWNRVGSSGELRWGADTSGGAPYVYQNPEDPSRLIGFELDIMEALAKSLGVKAKLVAIPWDQLIPSLLRDDCDIAFNGLEVTADRAKTINFSNPYYVFSEQITVRRRNIHDSVAGAANSSGGQIRRFEDLRGRRVGTLSASLAYTLMVRDSKITVVAYPGPVEIYKDLEIGRLDAVLLDVPMAAYYAGPNPALENLPDLAGEGLYAGGLRKDSPVLRQKINEAVARMFASGEMESIYRKWNLWNGRQKKLLHPTTAKLSRSGEWSVLKFLPLLLQGAGVTILVSCLAMVLAVLLGFLVCTAKLYGSQPLRFLAGFYIEIVRGTPLLIQLYILYYGLPNLGIELNAFTAAVLGLGINYAAYEAEIYRAGLLSVPRGQTEAARSIGMSGRQSLFNILLPQAFRTILPPSTSDFIALFKDSSLVSIITVVELTKMYNQAATATYHFLELGLVTAAMYFAMSYPLALWSRHLEERQRLRHV